MEKIENISNVELNQLYTLTNIISYGITINTGKDTISIPGLFNNIEHTKTDDKLLFTAVVMIYLSNNLTIEIDSYGETIICNNIIVSNKTLLGGGDEDETLLKSLITTSKSINQESKVILNIEPSSGRSAVYNLIRLIIRICTLFFTIKVLYYLYGSQMRIYGIISRSSIADVQEKYSNLIPTRRLEHGKILIKEYIDLSKDEDTTKHEDEYLEPYLEVLALSYKDINIETDTHMQLQIYTIDDPLPSIDELNLNNLGETASYLIMGYQELLLYFPFLKLNFIDTDDFIHNYAIYQKASEKFTIVEKEITELQQLLKNFEAKLLEDIKIVDPRNKEMTEVIVESSKAAGSFVTGFITGITTSITTSITTGIDYMNGKETLNAPKTSKVDIALSKKKLIEEILSVWGEIISTSVNNSDKLFKSITGSFTQLMDIYSLIQWQIVIAGIINSFANYIIYKYVLKNTKVKLNPKAYKTLTENINNLIKSEMNTYYRTNDSRLNETQKEELINTITNLLNTFMFKGKLSLNEGNIELTIPQKTSNVIDFSKNQSEILADVKKFVFDLNNALEKIDIFSYNSIVNVFNTFFGNIDNSEEDNIQKISQLLNQIYDIQSSDYISRTPNQPNILRLKEMGEYDVQEIKGGKKHNKIRKTRKKRSKTHKRTRRYKRFKMNRSSRRIRIRSKK
jgi:hypothetical protein